MSARGRPRLFPFIGAISPRAVTCIWEICGELLVVGDSSGWGVRFTTRDAICDCLDPGYHVSVGIHQNFIQC